MTMISEKRGGVQMMLQGNEAIARGALEGGVLFCAAYPGNPSSEIIQPADPAGKKPYLLSIPNLDDPSILPLKEKRYLLLIL